MRLCIYWLTLATCSGPSAPKNGYKIGGNCYTCLPSDTVKFICKPGFTLNGSAAITCENGGKWNASIPRCEGNTGNLHFLL